MNVITLYAIRRVDNGNLLTYKMSEDDAKSYSRKEMFTIGTLLYVQQVKLSLTDESLATWVSNLKNPNVKNPTDNVVMKFNIVADESKKDSMVENHYREVLLSYAEIVGTDTYPEMNASTRKALLESLMWMLTPVSEN